MSSGFRTKDDAFDLARIAVDLAAKSGGMIAATAMAIDIFKLVPMTPFTVIEIEDEIVRRAFGRGVAVRFG